jgi:hypothetical protein
MRQATTAKACHDLAKSARSIVPVLSTAGFNRTLRRTEHDLSLPEAGQRNDPGPATAGIWRMSA